MVADWKGPSGSGSVITVLHRVFGVAWYAVVIGAPAYAAGSAARVLGWSWSLHVVEFRPSVAVRLDVDDARLAGATGWFRVDELPTGAALACVGLWLAGVLLLLPVVRQLRRLTGSIMERGPFGWPNVDRIWRLGATMMVVAAAAVIPSTAMSWIAAGTASGATARFDLAGANASLLLAGVVVLAFAEICQAGGRLQEDHELTV